MTETWKQSLTCTRGCGVGYVRPALCRLWLLSVFLFCLSLMSLCLGQDEQSDDGDILTPYLTHHGPQIRRHRDTRECQSVRYGNVTHSRYPANQNATLDSPLLETHYILKEIGENYWDKRLTYINHQVVFNPVSTWSVLEPGYRGTCQNGSDERFTVQESADQNQCILATNAGYFNTHTGQCLGNIVSDGWIVQDSGGIQNVHFGVTKDGSLYTGYLSELDLLRLEFTQLVGGVIWLVRDGQNYVEESKAIECPDTEETGTMDRFASVISARTAVGHDDQGRIHMVQVNGKTDKLGVNLYEFADLLLEFGVVNAINLDGGGSATTVFNGTLVNYPSDKCVNSIYNCARKVSTILCVHQPYCSPSDCSGHGSCDMGVCQCHGQWSGPGCDQLECLDDCSNHGECTEDGCQCHPGWQGRNCSLSCPKGWYGINCSLPCMCENDASCDIASGACICLPGYSGKYCQAACPFGFYGEGCKQPCLCQNSCHCDHVTGNCNVSFPDTDYYKAGKCLAKLEIKQKHLAPSIQHSYNFCMVSVVCISIVATASLLLNVTLTYLLMKTRKRHQKNLHRESKLALKYALRKIVSRDDDTDDNDMNGKVNNLRNKWKTVGEEVEEEDKTSSEAGEEDLFLAPKHQKGKQ